MIWVAGEIKFVNGLKFKNNSQIYSIPKEFDMTSPKLIIFLIAAK